MNTKLFLSIAIILMTVVLGQAQPTKSDYQRADSIMKLNDLVYSGNVSANWLDSTSTLWYSVKTRKGTEYKLVDAVKAKVSPAFDQEKLSHVINTLAAAKSKPFDLGIRRLEFIENGKKITFE